MLVLAILGQIVGEGVALHTDEGAYTDAMPLLPLLGIGLAPVLRMLLLILPTFWLAQRLVRSPAEAESHSLSKGLWMQSYGSRDSPDSWFRYERDRRDSGRGSGRRL